MSFPVINATNFPNTFGYSSALTGESEIAKKYLALISSIVTAANSPPSLIEVYDTPIWKSLAESVDYLFLDNAMWKSRFQDGDERMELWELVFNMGILSLESQKLLLRCSQQFTDLYKENPGISFAIGFKAILKILDKRAG